MNRKTMIAIIVILLAIIAIAWHRITRGETSSKQPYSFCPHINEITQSPVKMNWTANTSAGFWKSSHMSFATNLTRFLGAQWVGQNVGQITCVYASEQTYTAEGQQHIVPTINVLLVFHTLAHEPQQGQGAWQRVQQGVYNCQAAKLKDCPFKVNLKPESKPLLEEVESIKSQPAQQLEQSAD